MEQSTTIGIAGAKSIVLLTALALTACLDEDNQLDGQQIALGASIGAANISTSGSAGRNQPPTIAGSPQLVAAPGADYTFLPVSGDLDGDRLGYSIRGKPSWASFDPNTGRLTGTPDTDDVGLVKGIVISVSDGKNGSALPAFSIQIFESATALAASGLGNDAGSGSGSGSGENLPPQLSGSPAPLSRVNQLYFFQPQADDPEGDRLTFEIANKPAWLDFDSASGTLSGIPNNADVGSYGNIWITVSDGQNMVGLGPLALEVVSIGQDSVRLSWQAPTENEDGSTLTDLGGYRIKYGVETGMFPNLIDITNPGILTFGIDDLIPDTYYFVITAYNSQGLESGHSNEATISL